MHRDDGKKWSRGTLGEGVSSDQGKSGFRKEGAVRSHKCPGEGLVNFHCTISCLGERMSEVRL